MGSALGEQFGAATGRTHALSPAVLFYAVPLLSPTRCLWLLVLRPHALRSFGVFTLGAVQVQDEIDDLDLGMDKKKKKSKKPKDDDDDAPSKSGEIEHWRAASLGPAVRCSSQQTLCE